MRHPAKRAGGGHLVLRAAVVLGLVLGLLGLGGPPLARAATMAVDCDVSTLISTISDVPDGTVLDLAADCPYTLTQPYAGSDSGLPPIDGRTLTIQGNGATIARDDAEETPDFRLFEVAATGTLHLEDLTLANGRLRGSQLSPGLGGAIVNAGTLTLSASELRGNEADYGGAIANHGTATVTGSELGGNTAYLGGAIYNQDGTTTVTNSTLSDNGAISGGAIYNEPSSDLFVTDSELSGNTVNVGGAIFNFGTATVTGSTLSGNTADGLGGAIYNEAGTATVASSTLSGNTAGFAGGAIVSAGGTVSVSGSTLSGNQAGIGGAIHNQDGATTVTAGTLSGNTAGTAGGAIFNASGTTTVASSTLSGNTGGYVGGTIVYNGGTVIVSTSILAVSEDSACFSDEDADSQLIDDGYNLATDDSCNLTAVGSQNGVSLEALALGELADNGGPTETIALEAGSVAIDAIPALHCTATTDQRGVARPQRDGCDVGAYERAYHLTTLSAVAGSGTYGGPATLTATLQVGDQPLAGKTITFSLFGTALDSATTGPDGVATLPGVSLAGIGAGTYDAVVAAAFAGDDDHRASSATGSLTVDPAAATLTLDPTTPIFVDRTTRTAPVTLRGTVTVAQGDPVTALPVTYTLSPLGGGTAQVCVDDDGGGASGDTLASACTLPGVPAGRYTLTASVGGNYTGAVTGTVVVVDPVAGFVTGGGVVQGGMLSFSASYYGTQLNGAMSYQRTGGGRVSLSTTRLTSFVRVGTTVYVEGEASLNGVSGHRVLLTAMDNPGLQRDQVQLEVWDRDGALVASASFDLTALQTGQVYIGPGL